MPVTRINNNQISDASAGNVYLGVNAAVKLQNYSITSTKIANNLTYGSDLTVSGNLTVNGTTTTIDTDSLVVEDPIILLAKNQTGSPTLDIGFIGERGTSTNIAFVWDESAGEFVTAFTNDTTTNTTITISSYASLKTLDTSVTGNLAVTGTSSHTGNATFGNISGTGALSMTGNITGGNLISGNAVIGNVQVSGNITVNSLTANTTVSAVGNVIGGNINTAGQVSATGNVTGGNINLSGNIVDTGALTIVTGASGNVTLSPGGTAVLTVTTTGANITGTLNTTGNANVGNLGTTGLITATGNVTGGNINTGGIVSATGNVQGGNITTAGQVSATGNVTGGNINTAGLVVATGNVQGGNLLTTGQVSATGNVNGGNVISAGLLSGATLETTGNALIGGNLVVQGNITYINIDDLRVEDPIIIMGTGPNGAPLTTDDGMDRGIYMEYYKTARGNASVFWDNSTGNMVAAANVNFSGNNVVNVLSYGTFQAGNIYGESVASGSTVSAIGNITGGNLLTAGLISATGNITGGNLNGGNLSLTGNIVSALNVTGNISGGNLLTAGLVSATGNVTGGNIVTGGLISATGNINGGNLNSAARIAGVTGYFTGNVDVLGNLNATIGVVYANSGIFYGDATTGNNAAFAGVPGFTQLGSNVVMQFAGNVNSYSQINFENVNSGNRASTDYIATADNGNDSTFFIDMGIASSTHNDPAFFGDSSTLNDGYLYIVANSVTGGNTARGNLILGSTNGNVKTFVGNTAQANVITTVASSGLYVNNGNLYTSNITTTGSRITVNNGTADIDFAVNGTAANIFYIDAGTGTASFGTSTQTTNALVAFNSTNSVLMPVGNTAQRPSTGVTGMLRFNTTADALEVYDADGWTTVGVPSFTVITADSFTGNGACTVFTLSSNSTTAASIVSINGVVQIPTTAYSVSGNVLTFTEAPAVSDVIDARSLTTTTTVIAISNAPGTAIVGTDATLGQVDLTGNLVPTSNNIQTLGTTSFRYKDLYLSGNSLYLGNLIFKETPANTLTIFQADGTTQANIDVGTIDVSSITSGTSTIGISGTNGNAFITVAGTANVQVTSTDGVRVTGLLSASGNVTGGNINTAGLISATGNLSGGNLNVTGNIVDTGALTIITGSNGNIALAPNGTGIVTATGAFSAAGNVTGGNINTAGLITATGNITGGNISVGTGTITGGNIVNAGSNGVGNIGSATTYFNTVFAKATSAQYADLAEMYRADADYAPGTVVAFGGAQEITQSVTVNDNRVAGVISTNPSYVMNSGLEGDHVLPVALTGRVPTRVTGKVSKGDMMVSNGDGSARAESTPTIGTVIGKALEDFSGDQGIIEVVVGRL